MPDQTVQPPRLNLGKDPVRACFIHYLMPAMTSMVIKSLLVMADIYFIGQSMGESGLAAINIVIPYFALMFAVTMMIGIGGSALMSIRFGEGNRAAGQAIFGQALSLITVAMIVLTGGTLFWLDDVVRVFGGQGELVPLSGTYLSILALFSTPYAIGWVLSGFVRNDGNPKLVMYAMIASASLNVFLDWLFMMQFGWGMTGAALATGIAQLVMVAINLMHFRSPKCSLVLRFAHLQLAGVRAILTTGLPTFFMETSIGLLITVSNWVLFSMGGQTSLSVYSIALHCLWLVVLLIYGVCQAAQPLLSFNHGAGNSGRILHTLKLSAGIIITLTVTFTGIGLLFPSQITTAFISSPAPQMQTLGEWVLPLYALAVIPMGLNIMTLSTYQAIAQARISSLLSIGRGLLLPLAGLFALPALFGDRMVWSNVLMSEALLVMVSLNLLHRYYCRLKRQHLNRQHRQ